MKMRRLGDRRRHQAIESGNELASDVSALPASLLLEIFVRLPIVAVIYCKSVCKSWYQLLSETTFSDHYEKHSGTTHLLLPVTLYFSDPRSEPFYLLGFDKNGNCTSRLIRVKKPESVVRWSSKFVFASCNGLIISSLFGKHSFISNPTTGGCIELPRHKKDRPEMDEVLYKIGFSPSKNKFKVVRYAYYTKRNDTEVYSLSILTVGVDDKWRRLALPCRKWWVSSDWVCFNGAFHFIVECNDSYWISTFDLAEEKFGRISHPSDVDLDEVKLELFDNRLTLIHPSSELHIDLWTMDDASTWSKDEIFYSWFSSRVRRLDKVFLVGKLRNGDVLLGDSARLIYIDVKGKTCSRIKVFHFPKIKPSIMPYTPRLISLIRNESHMHV